jgi:hypothetical protein
MTTRPRVEVLQLPRVDAAEIRLILHAVTAENYTQRITIARRIIPDALKPGNPTRWRYADLYLIKPQVYDLVGVFDERAQADDTNADTVEIEQRRVPGIQEADACLIIDVVTGDHLLPVTITRRGQKGRAGNDPQWRRLSISLTRDQLHDLVDELDERAALLTDHTPGGTPV